MDSKQTIYLGSDSGNRNLKNDLKEFLTGKGYKCLDLGAFNGDATDFAVIQREVDEKVHVEENALGLLIYGKNPVAKKA